MALNFNEIVWWHRLNEYNHTPHFPTNITGSVDTMPVYVLQPKSPLLSRLLYNPKYGAPVYKLQLATDFLGRLILFSGPHFGTEYDGHIQNPSICTIALRVEIAISF